MQSERNAPDTKKLVGIKRSGADGKDQEYAEWHYLYGQKLKRKLRRGKQYKSVR